jgi:hypothetical protein
MFNQLDDHDLIDGFGSYPEALQTSAVFSSIGSVGYKWYLLFQSESLQSLQILVERLSLTQYRHVFRPQCSSSTRSMALSLMNEESLLATLRNV